MAAWEYPASAPTGLFVLRTIILKPKHFMHPGCITSWPEILPASEIASAAIWSYSYILWLPNSLNRYAPKWIVDPLGSTIRSPAFREHVC